MTDLKTALPLLRAPFSPAAVKWKVQTNPKNPEGSALMVAFIDARLVAERLNYVCPGDWSDSYEQPFHSSVVCSLTVLGSTRQDVGWGSLAEINDKDLGVKTMYSDAFKRAAVKFGVGAFLYALPKQYVKARDLKQMGKHWYTTRASDQQVGNAYAQWLHSKPVVDRFGKYIDHGDELVTEAAPPPQNFDNTSNVEAVKRLVKEKGITVRALNVLLDEQQVSPGKPVERLTSASIPQLVAVAEHIERVAVPA